MDKILVNIYIVEIDKNYDVFLPINIKVSETINLIQDVIKEYSEDYYIISKNACLYDFITGNMINSNNIVKNSGIKNGCKLLLVG